MAALADPSLAQVTIDDVRAAARRIEGAVMRTPTLHSRTLSELTGAQIYLKFENLQFTASYKERGALNKLLLNPHVRERGVIAASAGNHAQGLAYHANRLGVPATIVMPVSTPSIKISQTQGHGARIVLHGETFDDAYARACTLAEEQGLTFVHPFDDPQIIAGQGTVALEVLEDVPDLDTLIIPIGGGGLVSGCGVAARALRPDIGIVGVQAEMFPAMFCKLNGRTMPSSGDTIAEGIAVKEPGRITSGMIDGLVDEIVLVSEREIETAVSLLVQIEKTVVEGAGAAGLAAVMNQLERFKGRKLGLVITGGNIDTRLLATVLLRDLARSGRMARLRIHLQDRPGALHGVVRLFDKHQVNIVEVYHQRIFTHLPAKDTIADIECEARDAEQLDALVEDLKAAGFAVQPVEIY